MLNAEDLVERSVLRDREESIPLQRINTGVSSIVGADNGSRAGGYVLVVDDSALLEVNQRHCRNFVQVYMNLIDFRGR